MADAITLDSFVDTDVTPDAKPSRLGGLWSRVQKVSQNLRSLSRQDVVNHVKQTGQNIVDRVEAVKNNFVNMTPEQKKTVAYSVAAGLATKGTITLATALLGTVAVGAATIVGAAMATGATVSLVQTAVTHSREGKSLKSFFNLANLKKVGTSAILAGGTAGWGDVLHNLLGQTVTHAASTAMNAKMNSGNLSTKLFAMTPGSNAHAAAVPTTLNVPQPMATATLDAAPSSASPAPTHANAAPVAPAANAAGTVSPKPAPTHVNSAPVEAAKAKVTAPVAPAANAAGTIAPKPAANLAPAPTTLAEKDAALARGRAWRAEQLAADNKASAPAAPAKVVVPTPAPVVDPAEIPEKVIAKLKLVLSQEEVTNNFTDERLRDIFKTRTGLDAPANATAADLAKELQPTNPDTYLKAIQQQAPQLDTQHLAASCGTTIPEKTSALTKVKTMCFKFKQLVSPSDFVVVDSGEELRFVRPQAVNLATSQSTNDFIANDIGGEGGVVQEMAEAKWAAQATLQPVAAAP